MIDSSLSPIKCNIIYLEDKATKLLNIFIKQDKNNYIDSNMPWINIFKSVFSYNIKAIYTLSVVILLLGRS